MIRWISSYPKSGNTWVRLFLMAYADPGVFDINHRSTNYTQDTNPGIYQKVSPVDGEDLTETEVRLLRGAVLVWMVRRAPDKILYLKTHSSNIAVNDLAWIPPEYTDRALYIIRDPRDVVVSLADYMDLSIDSAINVMANENQNLDKWGTILNVPLLSWSLHVQSWRRKLPYDTHALRYEDLIADPEQHFQFLINFFKQKFDRTRFNEAMNLTSFEALQRSESNTGFDSSSLKQKNFFRSGKAGSWTDVLTDQQEAKIIRSHKTVMQECGYLVRSLECEKEVNYG